MTISDHAAAALARARAAGVVVPSTDTAHQRRVRAAISRDLAVLLGVSPLHIVVTDDPLRDYGAIPGHLITVTDPDDPAVVLRFIPEPGNLGTGGGAYLLLDPCPGCSGPDTRREVPMMSVTGLADLGVYQHATRPHADAEIQPDPPDGRPEVPVEFFDDLGHAPDCPLA